MQTNPFSTRPRPAEDEERDSNVAPNPFSTRPRPSGSAPQSTLPPFSPDRASVRQSMGETGVNLNVDYESNFGVDPLTRGWANIVSDNPEELQRWAQRRYGPEAVILRGSAAGAQPGTPEYGSLYISRGMDQPFQVFDPSQELAAQRFMGEEGGAIRGALGRTGEILSETAEVGTEFLPELAAELALTRGGGTASRLIRGTSNISGWRLRGLARGAGYAGASAGAAYCATLLENALQEYAVDTNVETADEIFSGATGEAQLAAGLSLLGSGLKFGGYSLVDALIGKASPEGEDFIAATRALNERIEADARTQGMTERELADYMRETGILDPLNGWVSDNPFGREMLGYLSRVSNEINRYRKTYASTLSARVKGKPVNMYLNPQRKSLRR